MTSGPELHLDGRCAFRMLPTDDLVNAPSTAILTRVGAEAVVLRYEWSHPDDGPQQGALLVGAANEDGEVEGAWFDTWHQQPALMRLTGSRKGSLVELAGTYAVEWGWQIILLDVDGGVTMRMRNVVPESALANLPPGGPPQSAGPYDVMVAEWSASRP